MSQNQAQIESSHNEIKKENSNDFAPIKEKHVAESHHSRVNANGFTQRLTPYQIVPAFYACLMFIQIGILASSLQSNLLKIGLAFTYSLVTILLCWVWFRTTSIDPTDTTQILHREAIKNEQPFSTHHFRYFCHICQTCVTKDSFHCRKCHRCVQLFDHHCKWLNNCIGAKNYLEFLALIFTVEITLLLHIIVNSVHIGFAFSHQIQLLWIHYAQLVFVSLDTVFFFANSTLVVMHLYLVINKKTTLQLILERRKANKIFPTQPNPSTKEEKASGACNQEINSVTLKIKRRRAEKEKNSEMLSFKKSYSFKTRAKSFKIKPNHLEN